MPIVSVIIPTFNSAKYLPKALDSVFGQDYSDFEIIVVDDGSTDNTKDVVNQYRDTLSPTQATKIKYIYKENSGAGSARNAGVDAVSGEYIAFLDADDDILKSSISERVEFLEHNKEVNLVFTDYYLKKEKDTPCSDELRAYKSNFWNNIKNHIKTQKEDRYILRDTFYANFLSFEPFPIWTGTVLIRKEIIHSVGHFREDISVGEDRDYWMRIAKNNTVGYIDKPLSCYNYYQSNLSRNKIKYYSDRIKLFKELYGDEQLDKRLLKNLISEGYFQSGYYYYKNGLYLKSKSQFFHAMMNSFTTKILLFMFAPPNKVAVAAKERIKRFMSRDMNKDVKEIKYDLKSKKIS